MTVPSFSTLITPQTYPVLQAQIIAFLQNPGSWNGQQLPAFPATAWTATSMGPYFVNAEANSLSGLSQAQVNIAMSGFLTLASDPSLQFTSGPYAGTSGYVDVIAFNVYNLTRAQATASTVSAQLQAASTATTQTFAVGQLTITDAQGNLFSNSTGGTLNAGSTLTLNWQAQQAGSAGNLVNSTPVSLVTSIPGVSVVLITVSPNTSCVVTAGTDIQSDLSLVAQCQNQWATLGTGSPAGAWSNWCFAASTEVRYATSIPTGLGSVLLVVYGANTAVSANGLAAISTYVTSRIPECSFLSPGSPYNAVGLTVSTVSATVYAAASALPNLLPLINTALNNLVQSTPINGYSIAPGAPDVQGISNSDFVVAIQGASSQITSVQVSVSGVPGANFMMQPAAGIPVVAQVPSGSNPYGITLVGV